MIKGSASVEQCSRVFDKASEYGAEVDDLRRATTEWRFECVVAVEQQLVAVPTYGIEIFDDDHGYVAEGLVTHNSSGADVMDIGLMRVMPYLKKYRDCWPILQIHDAAVFECYEEDAEALKIDVIEAFTQEHTNPENGVTISFPIEPDIGDDWAHV